MTYMIYFLETDAAVLPSPAAWTSSKEAWYQLRAPEPPENHFFLPSQVNPADILFWGLNVRMSVATGMCEKKLVRPNFWRLLVDIWAVLVTCGTVHKLSCCTEMLLPSVQVKAA